MLIINPGTEARDGATEQNAQSVAADICKTLSIPAGLLERDPSGDGGGWFRFKLNAGGDPLEIDIPGDDPATVIKGKPFVSRRLYVDGSSWLYGYALNRIEDHIRGASGSRSI